MKPRYHFRRHLRKMGITQSVFAAAVAVYAALIFILILAS